MDLGINVDQFPQIPSDPGLPVFVVIAASVVLCLVLALSEPLVRLHEREAAIKAKEESDPATAQRLRAEAAEAAVSARYNQGLIEGAVNGERAAAAAREREAAFRAERDRWEARYAVTLVQLAAFDLEIVDDHIRRRNAPQA
jgi:hypothetical protein